VTKSDDGNFKLSTKTGNVEHTIWIFFSLSWWDQLVGGGVGFLFLCRQTMRGSKCKCKSKFTFIKMTELAALREEFASLLRDFESIKASQLDRHLEENGSFSTGDIALLLSTTSFVIFMTLPGVSLFYAGGVKVRNILSVYVSSMSITALVTCLWFIFGYSLAFSPSNKNEESASVFGDANKFWLHGLHPSSVHQNAIHLPETLYCAFTLSNAIIACALLNGGFIARAKYIALLLFTGLWLLLVYCPLVHTFQHPNGYLFKANVLDFAGGLTVHIAPGITVFVIAYLIGKRDDIDERFESRNMLLAIWGACFLWIGWLAFNLGSAHVSGMNQSHISHRSNCPSGSTSGMTIIITMIGATTSAISWTVCEWTQSGHSSILGIPLSTLFIMLLIPFPFAW
jgi:ammonium transporter, Amt family